MIVEFGHFTLILALVIAGLQTALPLLGVKLDDNRLMATATPAALVQLALITASFLALMYAYVTSDFSVENVWANSHSAKPMLYKISGVWGNHEGSMLLWVLILAAFGACVAAFGRNLPLPLKAAALAVQASIAVAFLLFIVTTSNPFFRLEQAPIEGRGLNPILQDPALAFHPPFLYAGYVGFSMAFSFAVAALITQRVDAAWARWVRPWTLLAWMCLTMGVAMGSWWAYYELGWGGWWFWDPVENASLMPWLAGTALLHSAVVMEKREALKIWTVLLAILAFSLSLMGTFLVRSGVLSSVHAFAVDPKRGVFVLAIMAVFIGGSLTLFAMRASGLRQGGLFSPISREASLVLNNILLMTATATVLIGTLYPLALEALGGARISVGPPYFNMTFVPLMVPLLLTMPLGPLLAWKRADIVATLERTLIATGVAVAAIAVTFALQSRGPWIAPFAMALGVWAVAGAIAEIAWRIKLGSAPITESWRRFRNLPRSSFGTALAHAGVGVMVIGIVAASAWQVERTATMRPGDRLTVAGYEVQLRGIALAQGANYQEQVGRFTVSLGGAEVAKVGPSRRLYDAPKQATTEAGILPTLAGDLYVVLGEDASNGAFAVRVYFNPLVRCIWLGAILMFLGGLLSLSDRRLRVGAPRRMRPVKSMAPVPAE